MRQQAAAGAVGFIIPIPVALTAEIGNCAHAAAAKVGTKIVEADAANELAVGKAHDCKS